ncbi:MAG: hypothetical protein EBZ91_06585 [Gammaproteobacteria bacterium]|nr:hypothetical protein [Gammaproteobacteria bacterium]
MELLRNQIVEMVEAIETPIKGYGPCVVMVFQPDSDDRLYGPFKSGMDALVWAHSQRYVPIERFGVMPLRTPDRKRDYNDFWQMFETQESLMAEFPESVYDWWRTDIDLQSDT